MSTITQSALLIIIIQEHCLFYILRCTRSLLGTWQVYIQMISMVASIAGRVIGILFLISLFFEKQVAWYSPILIAVSGFLSTIITIPVFSALRSILTPPLLYLLSLVGLIYTVVIQVKSFL